ncbi:MAG: nucleoside monophosphate kinase [Candidatus Saccharibacteria bacterium]|nr:nucleoside monophosphate kinase [Candidatus Saccharibacteria bacterium]
MEEKIAKIRAWLGTGSINVFGLPFSGKDTVGLRLAETIGAKFLSSGLILRAAEAEDKELAKELAAGNLAPTDTFRRIIMPYFGRADLAEFPLVLSSVGRWEGEEYDIIDSAAKGGHDIKAVLLLNVSEDEAKKRWEVSRTIGDRGTRSDDKEQRIIDNRINEFITKTMPVIETYRKRDLLIPIHATGERDAVFMTVIDELCKFIDKH